MEAEREREREEVFIVGVFKSFHLRHCLHLLLETLVQAES